MDKPWHKEHAYRGLMDYPLTLAPRGNHRTRKYLQYRCRGLSKPIKWKKMGWFIRTKFGHTQQVVKYKNREELLKAIPHTIPEKDPTENTSVEIIFRVGPQQREQNKKNATAQTE